MSLFTRINIISGDLSMPVIPTSDIDFLIPMESDAYEHWMFDSGAASLGGVVNGRALTPGAIAPVYGTNYISVNTTPTGALKTPKNDAADQTLCVVYRRPAISVTRYLAGTLDSFTGSSLLASGTGLGILSGNQRPSAQITPITHPGVIGDWVFAAFSEKSHPTSKDQVLFMGGQPALTANVGVKALAARQVVLGNGSDGTIASSMLDFAEFIVFDKALTADELQEVYLRAKTRMASVGINV